MECTTTTSTSPTTTANQKVPLTRLFRQRASWDERLNNNEESKDTQDAEVDGDDDRKRNNNNNNTNNSIQTMIQNNIKGFAEAVITRASRKSQKEHDGGKTLVSSAK